MLVSWVYKPICVLELHTSHWVWQIQQIFTPLHTDKSLSVFLLQCLLLSLPSFVAMTNSEDWVCKKLSLLGESQIEGMMVTRMMMRQ
jgi:hypothetical protein